MPNLQRRGYTFSLPTAQQQWMSYMTWTALVSKIVQYPSKTNEESEHTTIAKSLCDTMDRRAKKTPDKQLVNFFAVRINNILSMMVY
jgi:hypothetical protein